MKNDPIHPILVIDDDHDMLSSIELLFRRIGLNNVILCSDSRKVEEILDKTPMTLILLDLDLPYISGGELLKKIRAEHPQVPVIIVTATYEVKSVVQCMRDGAIDYMTKPINEADFSNTVFKAIEDRQMRSDFASLKEHLLSGELRHPELFSSIITNNPRMIKIFQYMESVAGGEQPALITGESGTGKELIARAVHRLSGREGSFETVVVAGVDDTFFSDTLFGHKKGSFTGATEVRKGFIEKAVGGTLFLDEIGDLSITSQLKLLRLIEYKEYVPIGSDIVQHSHARIVAATSRNLVQLMDEHKFRKDLYYRFTHLIGLPPLRERSDDIPLLADAFLEQAAREYGKADLRLSDEAVIMLNSYGYPENNIRELQKIILNAAAEAQDGLITKENIIKYMPLHDMERILPNRKYADEAKASFPGSLPTIKEVKKLLIDETLKRTNGSQSLSSEILGISRMALYKWLKKSTDQE
jgi:DNA-binding NtrC family response regulator